MDAEDEKLVTLARASRARIRAAEGAAVRDEIGRTYVATTVALNALQLSAVQAVVAAAASSGVQRLEAAAIVTEADATSDDDRRVLAELGVEAPIIADPSGDVRL